MKRILIVDDEAIICRLISTALQAAGFETVSAGNGIEALEEMVGEQPDLILMDVVMPEGDGIMALQQIRLMPDFKDTPVIMMTGKAGHKKMVEAMELGITAYLTKSHFSLNRLIELVQ